MIGPHADLTSVVSSLDDLIGRVVAAADALPAGQDHVAADLFEVERSLRTGARRLASVVRQLDPEGRPPIG